MHSLNSTESGKYDLTDLKISSTGIEKKEKTPISEEVNSVLGTINWDDIEVICKLGAGASASVKKIKNTKDGKLYAMKVLAIDKNEQKEKTITSEVKAVLIEL